MLYIIRSSSHKTTSWRFQLEMLLILIFYVLFDDDECITFDSYRQNSIFENIFLLSILRICLFIILKSFRTFKLELKLLSLSFQQNIVYTNQKLNLIALNIVFIY